MLVKTDVHQCSSNNIELEQYTKNTSVHTHDTDFKTMSEQTIEKQTSKDFNKNLTNMVLAHLLTKSTQKSWCPRAEHLSG